MKRRSRLAFPIVVLLALPAAAAAAERAVTLDAEASQVTFTLDTTFHEVHGTMPLTGGTIHFDPQTGAASGEIAVDARRAETGNEKRDKKMHGEVLETEQYPTILFRAERVEGTVADTGHAEIRLAGVMSIHGADHPMTLTVKVESANGQVRGDLEFAIPYVEWGMHDPSFLIARAAKSVDVKVHVVGRWTDAVAKGN